MLVIISDLHLTDGTSSTTVGEGAFRVFRHRLRDLAYDASWRSDGVYQPIESFDIVLLGDIFDLLRSTRWLEKEETDPKFVRPWHDVHAPQFIELIQGINRAMLDHNAGALNILKNLGQTITLPPATASGQPAEVEWEPESPQRVPVDVRLHYMVGNHDWFYHLPGEAYHPIRQEVIEAMGLSNESAHPFPHDLSESDSLRELCLAHHVFARHGDIFDPYNFDEKAGRNAASLGDAVVVELVNRFPSEVQRRLGDELPPACLAGLRAIDHVRPMLMIPIWLNGLLHQTCGSTEQIKKVTQIWDELADHLLSIPFVRRQDTINPLDNVDKLEVALKFSKGASLAVIKPLLKFIGKKIDADVMTAYEFALEEAAFQEKRANFIVHGHTHRYEMAPLDIVSKNGEIMEQIYLNSGTWRPIYELTKSGSDESFVGYHELTYLAFFKDGEHRGQSFEAWSGKYGG